MKLRIALFALVAAGAASSVAACGSSSEDACSSNASALTVCAKGAVIKGVDVSYYQGTIDWVKVKGAGIDFAISRVSDGVGFIDPKFAANWPASKKAGLVRGTYQFFEPAQDPIKQADLMFAEVQKAGGFQAGDLPPVLDVEVTGGLTPAQIQASMTKWLNYVEAKIGRKPIIYTAAFMSSNVGTGFKAYPLWVANYGPACPTMPSGWTRWWPPPMW
jgi:lysozyme